MAKKVVKKKRVRTGKAKRTAPAKKKATPRKKPASSRKATRKSVVKKSAKGGSASGRKVSKRPVRRSPVRKKKIPVKKKTPAKKKPAAKKKNPPKKRQTPKRRPKARKTPKSSKAATPRRSSGQAGRTAKKASVKRRPAARTTRRPKSTRTFIKIKIVGIGGGGSNAITRMRRNFSVRGVEFVAINTDVQDLESCDAHKKLHIGRALTKGMGAGMNPDLGQQAAEENRSEIAEVLKDTDMVFLTAGFGGGTGTGATPIIAEVARELGILTVAVITKPFSFEGTMRAKIAEDGMSKIKDKVDTLLIIPNDRIFTIIDKNTSVLKAFEKIDDILKSAVQGVAEVISSSGLVNVDFADIRSVTAGAGMAVIGVGSAGGPDRAVKAINQAINSPLLDISIDGARNVLFGVAGGRDMKMSEINEAARIITEHIDPGAKIIFGAYYDRKLKAGTIKITLIATGFNGMLFKREPDSLTLFAEDAEPFVEAPEITEESIKSGNLEGTSQENPDKDEESVEDILDTPTFLRKRGRRR